MKTLQNNYTTPEQSKRILELGVPADSADCCYPENHLGERVKTADYIHVLGNGERILGDKAIPCWSVGRLIEIYCKCHIEDECDIFAVNLAAVNIGLTAEAIKMFENNIKNLDFSKLED